MLNIGSLSATVAMSNALQEAVGHARLELQITLPQSQLCDVQ